MKRAWASFKKLIRTPNLFWRDYFLAKQPLVLNEIKLPRESEAFIINHMDYLERIFAPTDKIDVVYTWVDDSDPEWRRKLGAHISKKPDHGIAADAIDPARFSNKKELKYSIRAVREFMPWVNRIFIVTDNQRPSWTVGERVEFIDHQEIIDRKYLPTFNSHVIESQIYRIPNLSEHFIYFNDDVFPARPLSQGHFFQANGLASLFASRKSISAMAIRSKLTATLAASHNSRRLLWEWYGHQVDVPLVHTYVPLRKSTFEKVALRLAEHDGSFIENKFRSHNDLNLATFLVPWAQYFEGKSSIHTDVCHYFNVRSKGSKFHWAALCETSKEFRPHSFCANDVQAKDTSVEIEHQLQKIYRD